MSNAMVTGPRRKRTVVNGLCFNTSRSMSASKQYLRTGFRDLRFYAVSTEIIETVKRENTSSGDATIRKRTIGLSYCQTRFSSTRR